MKFKLKWTEARRISNEFLVALDGEKYLDKFSITAEGEPVRGKMFCACYVCGTIMSDGAEANRFLCYKCSNKDAVPAEDNRTPSEKVVAWLKNFPKQASSEWWYLAVAEKLIAAGLKPENLKGEV